MDERLFILLILHVLFDFDISIACIGSSCAIGGTQVPAGLKLIFLCSDLAGEEPRTCSYELMELTLWRDILEDSAFYFRDNSPLFYSAILLETEAEDSKIDVLCTDINRAIC